MHNWNVYQLDEHDFISNLALKFSQVASRLTWPYSMHIGTANLIPTEIRLHSSKQNKWFIQQDNDQVTRLTYRYILDDIFICNY